MKSKKKKIVKKTQPQTEFVISDSEDPNLAVTDDNFSRDSNNLVAKNHQLSEQKLLTQEELEEQKVEIER